MVPWAHPSLPSNRRFDRFSRFCRTYEHNQRTDRHAAHATPSVAIETASYALNACDAAFRRNYLITCFLFIHVVQTTASRLGNISDRVQGRIYQQGASIATANRLPVSGTGQALYKYCT